MNFNLDQVKKVYFEPVVRRYPFAFNILQNNTCEQIPIESHWKLPAFTTDPSTVESWTQNKRKVLVLGIKKKHYVRENGRSTDFVASSQANGCTAACNYCYVARRKGYANPITIFANYQESVDFTSRHAHSKGPKRESNQCDPNYWIYDIGENSDCSVDASISPGVKAYVDMFREHSYAKGSFATKFVNPDLLSYDPQRKTRIRFSLMPERISKVLDVRTDSIAKRLAAIRDFYDAGWEVHLNLSPVIVYPGWTSDYRELFHQINASVPESIRKTVKAEVIFLTHNAKLHDLNMKWHPKGEEFIWNPKLQEDKVSQTGGHNLRYQYKLKRRMIKMFKDIKEDISPWLDIRYIF